MGLAKDTVSKESKVADLDVTQAIGGQVNGLIETDLPSIGQIQDLNHLANEPGIQGVAVHQLVLQFGAAGQDQAGHLDRVILDEMLDRALGHAFDIGLALALGDAAEPGGRLTAARVLVGQVDGEL